MIPDALIFTLKKSINICTDTPIRTQPRCVLFLASKPAIDQSQHSTSGLICWIPHKMPVISICIFMTGKVCIFLIFFFWNCPRDSNRRIWEIPQYIRQITPNAPFCNRNLHTCAHFCYKMVHCQIWDYFFEGFVQQVYWWFNSIDSVNVQWQIGDNILPQPMVIYNQLGSIDSLQPNQAWQRLLTNKYVITTLVPHYTLPTDYLCHSWLMGDLWPQPNHTFPLSQRSSVPVPRKIMPIFQSE